jgi:hypothetical protein
MDRFHLSANLKSGEMETVTDYLFGKIILSGVLSD